MAWTVEKLLEYFNNQINLIKNNNNNINDNTDGYKDSFDIDKYIDIKLNYLFGNDSIDSLKKIFAQWDTNDNFDDNIDDNVDEKTVNIDENIQGKTEVWFIIFLHCIFWFFYLTIIAQSLHNPCTIYIDPCK